MEEYQEGLHCLWTISFFVGIKQVQAWLEVVRFKDLFLFLFCNLFQFYLIFIYIFVIVM